MTFGNCYPAGPKLYKEPSFKSNKFIIHNAITRCCLAGKVNEPQKNKIVEVSQQRGPPQLGYKWLSSDLCCSYPVFPSLFRIWRKALPIISSSSSEIPAVNSEQFTPWTLKQRRWYGSLVSAPASSHPRWLSPFTSTALTASSSRPSRPKPCPWASTPSPSPVTFGKSAQELPKSSAPPNKDDAQKSWVEMLSFREPTPSMTPIVLYFGQWGTWGCSLYS